MSHGDFVRASVSNRLKCSWPSEKLGLWAKFPVCSSSLTSVLPALAHVLHIYSSCKVPLLGGGGVSRLPYTYRDGIVKRHFHTMRPALGGGIRGFTQAFSLPAHRSGGMACYKSGACTWLTSELAARGQGLTSGLHTLCAGYILGGKFCSGKSPSDMVLRDVSCRSVLQAGLFSHLTVLFIIIIILLSLFFFF